MTETSALAKLDRLEKFFEAAEELLWDIKVEDIEIVKQLRIMVAAAREQVQPGQQVHHLRHGVAACADVTPALRREFPGDWPKGNVWTADWAEVTCLACLMQKPLGPL